MKTLDEALNSLIACEVRQHEGEEGGSRKLRFIASTERVARDGDIIEATAWEFDDFLRAHPVFLWGHDDFGLPIGRVVSAEIITTRGEPRIEVVVEFDDAPFADNVLRLYHKGFLRSVSVRWRTLAFREPDQEERNQLGLGPFGRVITKAELLEVSAVSVPADPGAVLVGPERSALRRDLVSIRSAADPEHVPDIDKAIEHLAHEEWLERMDTIETKLDDIAEQIQSIRPVASDSAQPNGSPDVSPERDPWSPLLDLREALTRETTT